MIKMKEMLNYTQITNVRFVDHLRSRLWAEFILIDGPIDPNNKSPFDNIRQIRGLTNGGLPVFTFWIKPDTDIKIQTQNNGSFVLLSEKEPINIGSGIRIIADDLVLDVAIADHEQSIDIQHIQVESAPHGSTVDREILKYYKAPNYCVTSI
jgi:hypothetical protein